MIHGHIHNDISADFWPLLAAKENIFWYMTVTFDELLENNRELKSG